jgi:hypothetical protein
MAIVKRDNCCEAKAKDVLPADAKYMSDSEVTSSAGDPMVSVKPVKRTMFVRWLSIVGPTSVVDSVESIRLTGHRSTDANQPDTTDEQFWLEVVKGTGKADEIIRAIVGGQ